MTSFPPPPDFGAADVVAGEGPSGIFLCTTIGCEEDSDTSFTTRTGVPHDSQNR